MNEIPIGVYTTFIDALRAQVKHAEEIGIVFPYQMREFRVDAAAKR